MRKTFFSAFLALMTMTANGQTWDPNNEFLVWTKNVSLHEKETAEDSAATEKKEKSFEDKYFSYVSMCDWTPGMRFMVLPEKKDLVIKTFTNVKTGKLESSMNLRHKIMEYRGHSGEGELHERVDFLCIDDSTMYY